MKRISKRTSLNLLAAIRELTYVAISGFEVEKLDPKSPRRIVLEKAYTTIKQAEAELR